MRRFRSRSAAPARRRPVGVLKLLIAVAIAAAALPGADAVAYAPMPIYWMSPGSGSALPLMPRVGSTPVVIRSEPMSYFNMIAGIQLEVSSENVIGQDGTLSDDFVLDYDYIHNSDTTPGYYVTRFQNFRYTVAGTYYFQFLAYTYAGEFVASPVYWFVYDPSAVPAPAPAPAPGVDLSMSSSNAATYLRRLVKMKTGHSPSHLSSRCTRASASAFDCRAQFQSGPGKRYAGSFHFEHVDQGGTVYWTGTFSGRVARRSCLRRHGFRRCGRAVTWST